VVYTDAEGEARLRKRFSEVSSVFVEPGWEERWREYHRPIWIGPLWVGPPWEEPSVDAIAVVIDPGRAFGTGSHPTTRLCLDFLLSLEPGSLVDVGCGSGVLSIAAAKLGFGPITAIDHDEPAVEAARRNVEANGVEVDVLLGDGLGGRLPSADVGFANIDLASVQALGEAVDVCTLVTAGYFHTRTPVPARYAHQERRIDGGWAADRFVRE
jgi:ribosomal protein L11 methyltransferase